jgi:hypothetical protein
MRDFNHTLNVLVKAYLNGTLEHGQCSACAVGNIVMESCPDARMLLIEGWPLVFVSEGDDKQRLRPGEYKGEAKRQIDATGYTWQELARIEKAFEKHDSFSEDESIIESDMFNGLMAVVDVLAEIHNIDLQHREEAKALFVKA